MALPVTIPNTFANATASIPLSQLDTNFNTLANAVNGISDGSESLANVSVTGGTISNVAVSATTLNTSGAVVFNDAGADVDFRVEGDTDANLLFVDASTDRVGIGTNTPQNKLSILGPTQYLSIVNTTAGGVGTESFGGIKFFGFNESSVIGQIDCGNSAAADFAGTLRFSTSTSGGSFAERMRIDSSGNVGIGVSPTAVGSYKVLEMSGASGSILSLRLGGTEYGQIAGNTGGLTLSAVGATSAFFYTNGTERMRITSGGYLKASDSGSYYNVGALSHEFTNTANAIGLLVYNSSASLTANGCLFVEAARNTTNNTFYAISYYNAGAAAYKFRVADSGNVTNTNNSYGSISDVKLKQDIVDAGSQWDDIKGLRVRKYRWKSDPDGFMQMGLVAQEAELVSPGLIDEHPDYEEVEVPVLDDEGNPVLNDDGTPQVTKERNALGTTTKAIKYSVLYMKAVKALQEAMERIETLEAKVAALENA